MSYTPPMAIHGSSVELLLTQRRLSSGVKHAMERLYRCSRTILAAADVMLYIQWWKCPASGRNASCPTKMSLRNIGTCHNMMLPGCRTHCRAQTVAFNVAPITLPVPSVVSSSCSSPTLGGCWLRCWCPLQWQLSACKFRLLMSRCSISRRHGLLIVCWPR